MKRFFSFFLLFAFLCYLLFFPAMALESAKNGLLLWYQNLVPVLFPFMILSNLMIRTDAVSFLLKWIHPLFHLIWGTSIYGSYAILAGFLFGYPMGAKVLFDLQTQEALSETEAEYLIGFVNNLSPAFLITYLIHQNLKAPLLLIPTLLILYGAPLLSSLVFAPRYRSHLEDLSKQKNKASKAPLNTELIDACIFDGIRTITRLGAYIMLFSMLTCSLSLLPLKNPLLCCILKGSIEITSGIVSICQAPLSFPIRYLCLMALCSFGGICALIQTLSVFPMHRHLLHHYLFAKTLTILLSILLTLVFL